MSDLTIKRMADLAVNLLNQLTPKQLSQIQDTFSSPARQQIEYRPLDRSGLSLREMDASQKDAAMRLVEAACSQRGFSLVQEIINLETTLKEWDTLRAKPSASLRSPERYWLAIYGSPSTDSVWGYSFSGHHIVFNVTVVNNQITLTPLFLGSNPAMVMHGSRQGARVLAQETDLPYRLLQSFDAEQYRLAVAGEISPYDIITARDKTLTKLTPSGIKLRKLGTSQADLMLEIVKLYISRGTQSVAEQQWAALSEEDRADATFTWLGAPTIAEPHYYRITVGDLIIEYDCTQDDANHIHTVARDTRRDWGGDLLQQHYQEHH